MVAGLTMTENPFVITKAEGFNHSYEQLALLMQFKTGVADVLLSNGNVFIEGSRGSGKSMYLRMLSLPVKLSYQQLAESGLVEKLPEHSAYVGAYMKLAPTIFAQHEYENQPRFRELFQQLFNIYCSEHIVNTLVDASLDDDAEQELAKEIRALLLPNDETPSRLTDLLIALRGERKKIRQALNMLPYTPDVRSQPETLWEVAEAVTRLEQFRGMRVHLLVDEYDSLSGFQQRILNSYLRKRDFPLTFKIACKKHCLVLDDAEGRPLNPSGDFDRVELDDDNFGLTSTFTSYLEAIANKRLQHAGISTDVRTLLGRTSREHRPKTERQYAGFDHVTMLSSGIVRTFLELCRDIFSRCEFGQNNEPLPVRATHQDAVIKAHASNRWNVLSRDQSARPELQHMIEQIAQLFSIKSQHGAETQVIRLEVIDFDRASTFTRTLLEQALEYEALAQPNRERLQKNRRAASRGYLLNRLLCVHFRLEPQSRWDAEISSDQLERLILGSREVVAEVAKHPTKVISSSSSEDQPTQDLFEERHCPILDEECLSPARISGLGFLSCPLPKSGKIRDAIQLIKEAFANAEAGGMNYEIRTAEDYTPEGDIACKVCYATTESEFFLAEMSRLRPSVAMELGLAIARRMPTYILFNSAEQGEVPEPFASLEYIRYSITPASVKQMVEQKLIPFLSDGAGSRGTIRLGPEKPATTSDAKGVFVALPGTDYYQETVLPKLTEWLINAGLGPVCTEQEGQALHDLQRAATQIAKSRFCLIDITQGATTRALYLGMAQGYRKPFAILIDAERDPETRVFTNARSKAELDYHDSEELVTRVAEFFRRFGVEV